MAENHLGQDQLIRYAFGLLSDRRRDRCRRHLDACPDCRADLARLRRKFAALEWLRDEVAASEELISRTVAQIQAPTDQERTAGPAADGAQGRTGQPAADGPSVDGDEGRAVPDVKTRPAIRKTSRPSLRLWRAAAAAGIVLVGGILILSQVGDFGGSKPVTTNQTNQPGVAGSSDGRIARSQDQNGHIEGTNGPKSETGDTPFPDQMNLASPVGPVGVLAGAEPADAAGQAEAPPFAPASNIELVTLPRRDDVQLTIYNAADLTLVRENRRLTMKKGWNWLQFQWAGTKIDPTSLSLEPKEHAGRIRIEQLVFPPRLQQLGRWLIRSEVSGQVPFEITYFTSGLSWRAFYQGTLAADERTMRLQGYVRAANQSGEDYADAQMRLLVGRVHLLDTIGDLAGREFAYGRPGMPMPRVKMSGESINVNGEDIWVFDGDRDGLISGASWERLRPKEIVKEGLSEYFLYTIEGTETVPDGHARRLASFTAEDVPVVNLYKYEQERYGGSVVRFLSFANDREHNLGQTPIPGGRLQTYRTADRQGYLSYEGQSEFKYIPVNEDVELNLGAVRNVTVVPRLMHYETTGYRFDENGDISHWDERRTFRIDVTNTRAVGVRVEIKRNVNANDWEIENRGPFGDYEKYDKDTVQYTLDLEPRSQRSFTYVLTTHHEDAKLRLPGNPAAVIPRPNGQWPLTVVTHGLAFDGRTTRIEVPDSASLDLTESLTIEAWIQFEQGGTENPRIVSKGWETQTGYELLLLGTGRQRRLQFAAKNLGRFDSQSYLSANTWYHVAVTFNGQQVRIWLNGQMDGRHPADGSISVNDAPLLIGRNSQNQTDWYQGQIAMVRIWNRPLPPEELRSILIHQPTNPSGMVGWWDLRQLGNSTTVLDISNNGNTGIIHRGD